MQAKITESKITRAEFERLVEAGLPLAGQLGVLVERLEPGRAVMRLPFHEDHLRPGGTISGPVMMALADIAMYGVVLSLIGPVALAVTTNLNINFLRKPAPGDVIATGSILKLGRRLAVGEVLIHSEGVDEPVAHVTSTYSIPPRD